MIVYLFRIFLLNQEVDWYASYVLEKVGCFIIKNIYIYIWIDPFISIYKNIVLLLVCTLFKMAKGHSGLHSYCPVSNIFVTV